MPATDQTLRDVLVRLDALEQRNAVLEQQNATLMAEVADLRKTSATTHPPAPATAEMDGPLTRRQVLQRGLSAAAVATAVGVLAQRSTPDAEAHHGTSDLINTSAVIAHYVEATAQDAGDGVVGVASIYSADHAGVRGVGRNGAVGVRGDGDIGVKGGGTIGVHGASPTFEDGAGVMGEGRTGVWGTSRSIDGMGVYGGSTFDGYGVVGKTNSTVPTYAGVLGDSQSGDGVRGVGKTGVHGQSTNGNGVFGEGSGYGGLFKGGRSQLRLVPAAATGKPAGNHQKGELYLDNAGTLYICTKSTVGTSPAQWRKVTTTAV